MGVEPEQRGASWRSAFWLAVALGCPGSWAITTLAFVQSWESWDRCSRGFDGRSSRWRVGPLSPLPASRYTHKVRVRSESRFWQVMNKNIFKWSAESLRHDSFRVPTLWKWSETFWISAGTRDNSESDSNIYHAYPVNMPFSPFHFSTQALMLSQVHSCSWKQLLQKHINVAVSSVLVDCQNLLGWQLLCCWCWVNVPVSGSERTRWLPT